MVYGFWEIYFVLEYLQRLDWLIQIIQYLPIRKWKFYIYFSHFILLGHELNTSRALRIKVTGNQGSLCNLCGFPLAFSCVNTKRLILSHCSSACPCSRPFIWEFSISIIFSGGNNEWHSRSRWVIILQKNHVTFLCI